MFVLDSSASGKRDRSRLWFVIKQFVMDTINAIDLSRATIGATIFSNNIRLALRPKKRSGRVVLQKIWRQRYMAACSNTGEAMRRTAAIMNSRSLRGTKRTIVLVTDGVENIKGGKSALEAAQWARKKGINIVVVGQYAHARAQARERALVHTRQHATYAAHKHVRTPRQRVGRRKSNVVISTHHSNRQSIRLS